MGERYVRQPVLDPTPPPHTLREGTQSRSRCGPIPRPIAIKSLSEGWQGRCLLHWHGPLLPFPFSLFFLFLLLHLNFPRKTREVVQHNYADSTPIGRLTTATLPITDFFFLSQSLQLVICWILIAFLDVWLPVRSYLPRGSHAKSNHVLGRGLGARWSTSEPVSNSILGHSRNSLWALDLGPVRKFECVWAFSLGPSSLYTKAQITLMHVLIVLLMGSTVAEPNYMNRLEW